MYSALAKYYSELFPLTMEKISFAQKSTFFGKSYHILDIGCSTGDLCFNLSKSGHHLTGIDLDSDMIRIAQAQRVNHPELKINYHIMDMLNISDSFHSNQFHHVLCLGNTLVHLTELNKIFSFFNQVSDVLNHTGVLKGQILNYSYILRENIRTLPVIETENIRFERSYQPNGSLLQFQTVLKDKTTNTKYKDSVPLLPLNYSLLEELLRSAGFQNVNYYGSYNLEPFTDNSFYLVFEAFK